MVNILRSWLPLLGLVALAGCADQPQETGEAPAQAPVATPTLEPPRATVTIVQPMNGAAVTGPNLQVVYGVTNLRIAPAGTPDPGTGHHHLFVDVDPTPAGQVIPAGQPGIIHLGMAQTEHMVEGLAPGPHRLIAVVADGMHIPLDPPVTDTVDISVTAP